jgi:hypothetical protein
VLIQHSRSARMHPKRMLGPGFNFIAQPFEITSRAIADGINGGAAGLPVMPSVS